MILEITLPSNYAMPFSIYTRSDLRSASAATAYSTMGQTDPVNSLQRILLLYRVTAPVFRSMMMMMTMMRSERVVGGSCLVRGGWPVHVQPGAISFGLFVHYPVPAADRQRCGGTMRDSRNTTTTPPLLASTPCISSHSIIELYAGERPTQT